MPLVRRSDLPSLVRRLRRRRKRIVFTNGVFDLLHLGHVEYLAKARKKGDLLIVGLNRDRSVRKLKGPGRPIQSDNDRAAILLALRSVDYVVLFGESTPDKVIGEIEPDVLVKGADYLLKDIVGAKLVKSYGGEVVRVKLTRNRSSSKLLSRL